MDDNDQLMAEITAQSDRAADFAPRAIDLKALAADLALRFSNRTVEDIEQLLITVWGYRRLPCRSDAGHRRSR